MSRRTQDTPQIRPFHTAPPPERTVEELGDRLRSAVCLLGPDLEIQARYAPRDVRPPAVESIASRARQVLDESPPRRTHLYEGAFPICVAPVRWSGSGPHAGYLVTECPPGTSTSVLMVRVSEASDEIASWARWQGELQLARKEATRELALAVLTEETGVAGFWVEKLRELGVPLAPFYRPAVLHTLPGDAAEQAIPGPGIVLPFLQRAFERTDPHMYVGYRPDACYCSHGCYCVFFPDRRLGGRQSAGAAAELRHHLGRLQTTTGAHFVALLAEHSVGTDYASRVFNELVRMLPVAIREETATAVHTPQRYALQRLLMSLDTDAAGEFITRVMGDLIDSDAAHGTDIVRTLAAYLETGCSISGAATRLYFHRNTVHRHLERAEEILGVPLNDPETCFKLHLAVNLLRQHGLDRTVNDQDFPPA